MHSRCDMDTYLEMVYVFCLFRTIHFIVALRRKFPNKRILISKYDFSNAYRRMAHIASSAIQTILVHSRKAFIYLRLTFGAAANPAVFCGLSNMVCDLSNEITLVKEWDPDVLFIPVQPKVPPVLYVDPSIPIAPAREMAVEVPTTSLGRGDCFLDDIIKVYLNRLDIIKRNAASVPLAMHVSMRPLSQDKLVQRNETLSLNKLILEGTPSKLIVVLGWLIDTRRLLLRLPQDKFSRWRKELRDLIANPIISRAALESLIGKLVHVAYVIPLSCHFLSRLQNCLT